MSAERAASPAGSDAGTWTVLRLMRWSGEYLEARGVERGRLNAEHLLAHALGVSRLDLYLQFDRPLTAGELDAFRPMLRRRARREPLQHILGTAAFRTLELKVDSRVLIPRPETEVLVEEVLTWASERGTRSGGEGLSALDVGTGSGAIALSLAAEGPFSRVVAVDVSGDALEVARANAEAVGLASAVEFREGSLFHPLARGERFNVIVSNPPYVAEGDAGTLEPEVAEWEPAAALFAGPDGLEVVRAVVTEAAAWLEEGGLLALEVGMDQAPRVVEMLEDAGGYHDLRVRRDLAGRDRVVLARRA
ncbi:MAG: peptide chain release factor N(5)-glutamine methyltransferase [Gemmatimonadota bacterium]